VLISKDSEILHNEHSVSTFALRPSWVREIPGLKTKKSDSRAAAVPMDVYLRIASSKRNDLSRKKMGGRWPRRVEIQPERWNVLQFSSKAVRFRIYPRASRSSSE